MASFIIASTAFGDCSQSGIVKTALAFAAAGRKSSTVFSSAAERLRLAAAKTNDRKTEHFIVVEVGPHLYAHRAAKANWRRCPRSEERRVGKECRARWSAEQ